MAVILVGEVASNADTAADFTTLNGGANISGDDDFVQGTGAVGDKMSNTTEILASNNLTSTYNFSTGGTHAGYHVIMWFNTKTPVNSTGGLRIYAGNGGGGADGSWYVDPLNFYKGGFITKVVDTARDFDVVNGGWSLTNNPAQLTSIVELGGQFNTITSIMGSFNNVQVDQITVGLGLRVSGGTAGSPNTMEEVRAADEDTNYWGWWSSANGSYVGKGKLYIGPETGSDTSVFEDSAFAINFAEELVADDFYEINVRGGGTSVLWNLASISSANPNRNRWTLTLDSSIASFNDTNGVWTGARNIFLDSSANLTGTTMINCNKVYQSGATFDGVTVIDANTASGEAFIVSNSPQLISNCDFNYSTGHTLELTSDCPTAFTFSNNSFNGSYGANGSNEAAIYNNSGKAIVINVSGGDTPTYRNGTGASTTVNNTVTLTLTNIVSDSEVRIYSAGTISELDGQESVTGGTFQFSYTYAANYLVDIVVFKESYLFNEPDGRIKNFELPNGNSSIPISQRFDRNYNNP